MLITISLPATLAALANGEKIVGASGISLGDAVRDVTTRYPALAQRIFDSDGRLSPFVTMFLNSEDVRWRGGMNAPLSDGDEVILVAAVAGG
jgi:molybdopterin converting factor small subunit